MSKKRRKVPINTNEVDVHSCTIDLRLEILHNLPFFKNLSHDEVTEVNKLFNDVHFAAGENVYFSGDRAVRLYVIATGSVKLFKYSSDGKTVLVDVLKQGEFFGNLDPSGEAVYVETAEVQTPSCILNINSVNFRNILEKYPNSALIVLDIISQRLRESHEMLRQLSALSVENRIFYTLLKLAEKLGEQKEIGLLIQIPLSRKDIAEMTGTTPETASRIMSRLQSENIIETGRKWIAIKNISYLKNLVKSN
jgi:CRP-like cAMP-binding protein